MVKLGNVGKLENVKVVVSNGLGNVKAVESKGSSFFDNPLHDPVVWNLNRALEHIQGVSKSVVKGNVDGFLFSDKNRIWLLQDMNHIEEHISSLMERCLNIKE